MRAGLDAPRATVGGEALGNYPPAFTHLASISAAFVFDRALGARQPDLGSKADISIGNPGSVPPTG